MAFDGTLPLHSEDVDTDDVDSTDISSDRLECHSLAVRPCQEELLDLHDVARWQHLLRPNLCVGVDLRNYQRSLGLQHHYDHKIRCLGSAKHCHWSQ
jgi:hypothetical protein